MIGRKKRTSKYDKYNTKHPVLTVRVDPYIKERLISHAKDKEKTVSAMLELVIKKWLMEQE